MTAPSRERSFFSRPESRAEREQERNVDGPARGPAREGQNELEEQVLQGVSAESQNTLGGAGVLARNADNRAEINES